jgi:dinuclear metal center YbgI/SA1388 family protein
MSSQTSPFTQAVVSAMRKLYPEALADKSFDNTGLLLEAPFDPSRRQSNSVLLTIDLTKAVADEALENECSVVVAYHPIIFRGLKSLTFKDTQQASLLRLVSAGISVYCPHTAVDAVPGGMADWMCDIVSGKLDAPEPETHTALTSRGNGDAVEKDEPSESEIDTETETDTETTESNADSDPFIDKTPRPSLKRAYSKPTYPIPASAPSHKFTPLHPSALSHTRSVIHPSPQSSIDAANTITNSTDPPKYTPSNTGSGRLLTFSTPQPLPLLIERIASGVGRPKGFPVAIPQGAAVEELAIKTVAICPGSGSHVFAGVDADLYFTGELSHHEALGATERGGCVVSLFHSNSERGYLGAMKTEVEGEVRREWGRVREGIRVGVGPAEGWEECVNDEEVRVGVSVRDRDPFGIVVLQDVGVEGKRI